MNLSIKKSKEKIMAHWTDQYKVGNEVEYAQKRSRQLGIKRKGIVRAVKGPDDKPKHVEAHLTVLDYYNGTHYKVDKSELESLNGLLDPEDYTKPLPVPALAKICTIIESGVKSSSFSRSFKLQSDNDAFILENTFWDREKSLWWGVTSHGIIAIWFAGSPPPYWSFKS
jgi:hypothetical protein